MHTPWCAPVPFYNLLWNGHGKRAIAGGALEVVWLGWLVAVLLAGMVIAVVFWPPRRDQDETTSS